MANLPLCQKSARASSAARLTNIGAHVLGDITSPIALLTNGNQVIGRDFPPDALPAVAEDVLTLPYTGGYGDGEPHPGESADITYVIGLAVRRRLQFAVDIERVTR